MRKFLILLLFISSTFNSVKAEQLVLSDIIQETRNRILMQEAREKAELAMQKNAFSQNREIIQNSQVNNEKTNSDKVK